MSDSSKPPLPATAAADMASEGSEKVDPLIYDIHLLDREPVQFVYSYPNRPLSASYFSVPDQSSVMDQIPTSGPVPPNTSYPYDHLLHQSQQARNVSTADASGGGNPTNGLGSPHLPPQTAAAASLLAQRQFDAHLLDRVISRPFNAAELSIYKKKRRTSMNQFIEQHRQTEAKRIGEESMSRRSDPLASDTPMFHDPSAHASGGACEPLGQIVDDDRGFLMAKKAKAIVSHGTSTDAYCTDSSSGMSISKSSDFQEDVHQLREGPTFDGHSLAQKHEPPRQQTRTSTAKYRTWRQDGSITLSDNLAFSLSRMSTDDAQSIGSGSANDADMSNNGLSSLDVSDTEN
jgi:hypothetical protein